MYLWTEGMQRDALKQSQRVKVWTELMKWSSTLERSMCLNTGWANSEIPERYDHTK